MRSAAILCSCPNSEETESSNSSDGQEQEHGPAPSLPPPPNMADKATQTVEPPVAIRNDEPVEREDESFANIQHHLLQLRSRSFLETAVEVNGSFIPQARRRQQSVRNRQRIAQRREIREVLEEHGQRFLMRIRNRRTLQLCEALLYLHVARVVVADHL